MNIRDVETIKRSSKIVDFAPSPNHTGAASILGNEQISLRRCLGRISN